MRIQHLSAILFCLIMATPSYAQQEVKSREQITLIAIVPDDSAEVKSREQITQIAIVPDDSAIVESPDVMPEYIGGQDVLMKKLGENLVYPSECAEAEIQGKVVIKFVVDTKGKVKNIEVINSVHPALDAEAVRVVTLLDDWIPGKMNGETVNVSYTLPILFRLNKGYNEDDEWSKFFTLGNDAIKEGNIQHAISYYWECFDINPFDTTPISAILKINDNTTQFGSNYDVLTKAFQKLMSRTAADYYTEKSIEPLEWLNSQIISINPENLFARLALATVYIANNDEIKSEDYARTIMKLAKKQQSWLHYAGAVNIIGGMLLEKHEWKKAVKLIKSKVNNLKQTPEGCSAIFMLAEAYKHLGKEKEAIEYYEMAKGLNSIRFNELQTQCE